MRGFKLSALLLSIVMLAGLWAASSALAGEQPRRGGILQIALAADPPSLDAHQEQTFAVAQPMGALYNNLIVFDPHNYPQIIGDLAKSWTVSDDHLTYTFTLHQGVKFHDGSELTAQDVKASWDKIVWPSEGVISPRRSNYEVIKSIEAPDRSTVVFRLHRASPSFLGNLAHPATFIYAKKYLDQDPNYYKSQTVGTGPFKLRNYVRGSRIEMERNPEYWKKGFPYLDGITYFIIKDESGRSKALRSGRVDAELRFLPPAEVDAIKAQLGDKVVVAAPQNIGNFGVTINVDKKPFDDERVRKALSLALDRYDMLTTLRPITILDAVGGMMHPTSKFALSQEELQAFPGFGKDHAANLREARRLMAEAGYPNGFKTPLTATAGYGQDFVDAVQLVLRDLKGVGINAELKLQEYGAYQATTLQGKFE
ncbi:MAG: ABC transporter substrate-binding protein, partial [Nitrospinae bacterium]|nr:ABC transporter substrate-binding protein [Nitrospinota bacterium]